MKRSHLGATVLASTLSIGMFAQPSALESSQREISFLRTDSLQQQGLSLPYQTLLNQIEQKRRSYQQEFSHANPQQK